MVELSPEVMAKLVALTLDGAQIERKPDIGGCPQWMVHLDGHRGLRCESVEEIVAAVTEGYGAWLNRRMGRYTRRRQ